MRAPLHLEQRVFARLMLFIGGKFAPRHRWRLLGAYFTGKVAQVSEQPVIDHIAYGWVRHLSYSGGTLMNVRVGAWQLVERKPAGCGVAGGVQLPQEGPELVLLETLGEPYWRYIAQCKRLIPFVY